MHGVVEKGRRRFVRWDRGGEFFQQLHAGRGLAIGDLDNDGLIDVVMMRQNEKVAVLRNLGPGESRTWFGMELIGNENRSIIGTSLKIETNPVQWRFAKSGAGYLSSNDPRWVVGLGATQTFPTTTVRSSDEHKEERYSIRSSGYGQYREPNALPK